MRRNLRSSLGNHRSVCRTGTVAVLLLALTLSAFGCGTSGVDTGTAPAGTTTEGISAAEESTTATAAPSTAAQAETKAEAAPDKVTFVLDWTPNTNHTGIYSADAQGFFAEAGIDVDIIQPGEGTADTMVASGAAQFGIGYQEGVTFARASNVPLVSLAAVIQHNTSGFASVKGKGIATPKDFEGRKYGGWGSDIEKATLKVLMDEVGADVEKVDILSTGSADFFQASESDQVDFAWIFEGWTGIEARLKGIELNYIDLGRQSEVFDYYTPVIITSEELISDNPDLVGHFMSAAAKGYAFAIENPDLAAADLMAGAPELNPELVLESQRFLSAKYKDDAAFWGEQKTEVWDRYAAWLHENGFIETLPDMKLAWTNDFLTK